MLGFENKKILLFNDIDEKNMSTYTWKVLYPNDESSTTVLVYNNSGKRINRHVTLTKDEFCKLHIPVSSERTLNSIMSNELARDKREMEEAEKKTDEMYALRRSEIASAAARWPDKPIRPRPYVVRVRVKSGLSPIVHVYGPIGLNEEEQQKLARTKLDEMKKTEK